MEELLMLTTQNLRGRAEAIDSANVGRHATSVAGIVSATGIRKEARGIAPESQILSFSRDNDLNELADYAIGTGLFDPRVHISNHSYGDITGWTHKLNGENATVADFFTETRLEEVFGTNNAPALDQKISYWSGNMDATNFDDQIVYNGTDPDFGRYDFETRDLDRVLNETSAATKHLVGRK